MTTMIYEELRELHATARSNCQNHEAAGDDTNAAWWDAYADGVHDALMLLSRPDPIVTVHVSPYIAWQGPASEAHTARASAS